MSNFKTHALAGLAASTILGGATIALTSNIKLGIAFGVSTLVGSLISDIDTGSIPSRIFAWIGIAISGLMMYFGKNQQAAIVGLIYMGLSSDKHRGFTHSWVLVAILMVLGFLAGYGKISPEFVLLAPLSFGIAVHLIIDR